MLNRVVSEDMSNILSSLDSKEKLRGSKVLITGCAGFLGYYFLTFFSQFTELLGIEQVVCIDNFLLGKPLWFEKTVGKIGSKLKKVTFDIAKDKFNELGEIADADFIIHMASVASPTFYRKYPIETVDANVWGLRQLLEYYKDKPIKGFLYFSSSEIYGDPSVEHVPIQEDYRGNVSCIGPRACYDESKRFSETLCYLYAKQYSMPITIVRPFNNYGPGMKLDDKRVPSDFANAIMNGSDIVLYSDGSPTRTFCYVSDAVTGYLKALLYGKFDYFNIGIDKPEISVRALAEIYVEKGKLITGYKGAIKYEKHPDTDYLTHNPTRRCPQIEKAKQLLHYTPTVEVDEGVGRFLEYLITEKNIP
ncbi:MAG: NAD-dependent epimerase/dehydratase family protein [Nitrospirae bacterium]|nr:NAD-dependent epimerase/dehydratase family protein [Nitrospirota bacterium]MBF0534661.1 NAD-dependent epimerase/dehydratase family protein [Nitrospirota bacterium]MBF0616295.1 NAD-dependent epimerase/dehydratase family protein [Nitrospirota bacterium]